VLGEEVDVVLRGFGVRHGALRGRRSKVNGASTVR
jgi:hypothetical protein